ncbi:MAG: universal stress protein [Pirellulaceae bacterium]
MKVLLASDGSEPAMNAARYLSRLKVDEKLKLALLTVSMHPELTAHGNGQNPERESQEKEFVARHQSELQELFSDHCDDYLSTLHPTGNAAQVILDVAKRISADLIVLGAVGHSMVSRMLLGSVSDRVATHAECSVLVVRPPIGDQHKNSRPRKIVVAFDDSASARESVNELMAFSWEPDTEVTVIGVTIPESYLFGDEFPDASLRNLKEQTIELRKAGERVAKSLAVAIPHSSVKVLTSGHAGESIVNFAEQNESDLIVIGDSGRSQLRDFFLGSTTKYVLRHAPCSVWISRHHQIVSKS